MSIWDNVFGSEEANEKIFYSGEATVRVWKNGDYEIRAFGGETEEGNIFADNNIPKEAIEKYKDKFGIPRDTPFEKIKKEYMKRNVRVFEVKYNSYRKAWEIRDNYTLDISRWGTKNKAEEVAKEKAKRNEPSKVVVYYKKGGKNYSKTYS